MKNIIKQLIIKPELLILVFILVKPICSFAQFSFQKGNLSQTIQNEKLVPNTTFENEDSSFINLFPLNEQILVKKALVSNKKLDSIIVIENQGLFFQQRKHYFQYDNENRLLKSECFYFNNYNNVEQAKETRIYTNEGLLSSYKLEQIVRNFREGYDTEIIDTSTMELKYFYQEEKLIEKTTTYHYLYNSIVLLNGNILYNGNVKYFEYYSYDEKGKLIKSESKVVTIIDGIENEGSVTITSYKYQDIGNITFMITSDQTLSNFIKKIEYDINDTLKQTMEYVGYFYGHADSIPIDSIDNWKLNYIMNEMFDNSGRRKYIEVDKQNDQISQFNNYRAHFVYNEDLISHVSCFLRKGNINTGDWYEAVQIDFIYDEQFNILERGKTFWDERWQRWSVLEKNTYFYSNLKGKDIPYIKDSKPDKVFSIFPNPSRNILNILDAEGTGQFDYVIYNSSGSIVDKRSAQGTSVSISHLPSGIYWINICSNSKTQTIKFVKY